MGLGEGGWGKGGGVGWGKGVGWALGPWGALGRGLGGLGGWGGGWTPVPMDPVYPYRGTGSSLIYGRGSFFGRTGGE